MEMAAVANACDLTLPRTGLRFPPCGLHDLPEVYKPVEDGSQIRWTLKGVSKWFRVWKWTDGRPVFNDLRWGVYVVFEAPDPGSPSESALRSMA